MAPAFRASTAIMSENSLPDLGGKAAAFTCEFQQFTEHQWFHYQHQCGKADCRYGNPGQHGHIEAGAKREKEHDQEKVPQGFETFRDESCYWIGCQ